MSHTIALVGRPNVGKSTLFNCLTKSRDALVADYPGLTRDRRYGMGRHNGVGYLVVDTGGLTDSNDMIDRLTAEQARLAIREADQVLLLVDAREGLTAADEIIVEELRGFDKPVALVVNKIDGIDADQASSEFYRLGLGAVHPVAALHGRGVNTMMSALLPEAPAEDPVATSQDAIRIVFIGRPNVGKSTLVNRLLGEERVLASEIPGTTRDSIEIPFERDGQAYTLIDTAGVRRRSRVKSMVEKYTVIKSIQAIEQAHVAIALVDARQGVTEQDVTLLGLALEAGRSMVLAINKWDGLRPDDRKQVHDGLDLRLPFLDFVDRHFISALRGTGVSKLMKAANGVYQAATLDIPTSKLTRLLEQAVQEHPPPLVRGRSIKLRYAHQGGRNPPVIVIHGGQTDRLPDTYRRYLMNYFRKALRMAGTPIRLEFQSPNNPFAGRRNKLTPRQQKSRERMIQRRKS